MTEIPNLLVVCGRNKKRSRTAEYIFKNDQRFNIRSVGLSPQSNRKITENDLHWADLIFVMENAQKTKMRDLYKHVSLPKTEVLHIADDYEFMDEALVKMLTEKINSSVEVNFGL